MAEIHKRRVSYIIPPPTSTPVTLDLPPFGTHVGGRSYPLLVPNSNNSPSRSQTPAFASRNPFADADLTPTVSANGTHGAAAANGANGAARDHPRHRLGISSLAIDSTTMLAGADSPGGILYTGGRDGLVASWELHVPHKKRRGRRYRPVPGRGTSSRVRWERIGDGADWDDEDDAEQGSLDATESSSDEEDPFADGALGGGGHGASKRRREVPYEDRWEVDHDLVATQPPAPTSFRQSVQTHTDWVNAMILCNFNQTVITASSDRTIRAWSPHAPHIPGENDELQVPALIGLHADHVRSLAFARIPSVLFSGALDRDISMWDIASPRPNEPVFKVRLSDINDHGGVGFEGEWGSIYALGVDPAGSILAAGTPERVVRLWDPRSGDKSIAKLVGHTDCVRSIVMSDDGRYMLTGSSDTTIKLWSLGEHRCLHTFNHHTSSVWALHSTHPNLERFYSGSRDGNLCVVDVEQCGDMSEGECVVLAREGDNPGSRRGDYESKTGDEAIRSITSLDDEYVFTATASSDVRRWRDVGRRVNRLDLDFEGASYGDRARLLDDDSVPAPAPNNLTVPALGTAFEPTSIIDQSTYRNKKLSVDASADVDLLRIESRDSRVVAFAPSPSPRTDVPAPAPVSTDSPTGTAAASPSGSPTASALPPSLRDRLNPPGYRNSTLSGASIAGSIMSDASGLGENGELNGIPYENLVCLGLPDSPYTFGFAQQPHADEMRTVHSTVSLSSATRAKLDSSPETTTHFQGDREREREIPAGVAARMAFEDRDVAAEARPLREEPDEVITGLPGLIRAQVLNDRVHCLTLDTRGQVAVWHIVRGACIGVFAHEDIAAALELERGVTDASAEIKAHPHEVLELVQRRVEGRNVVLPWCQVDTKVGQITVHLEGDRVFNADALAEEVGLDYTDNWPEEARSVNIGKFALANLFRGLIKAEEAEVVSAGGTSPTSVTSSLPSATANRSPVVAPIALDRPMLSPRHRQRALSSSSGVMPSINIAGLATPAATPAQLPDISAPLGSSAPVSSGFMSLSGAMAGSLAPIAGSPIGSPVNTNANRGLASPSAYDNPAMRDYFSLRKINEASPTRESDKASSSTTPVPPTSPPPAASGGGNSSSLLGKKFKFGKKKPVEAPMAPVIESKRENPPPQETGPKLSERDKQQLHFLDTVRSSQFRPPSSKEAPVIAIPPLTSVIISEQSQDDSAYFVTYRSQVGSTERDMEPLEMNAPFWLLDYLFTSSVPAKFKALSDTKLTVTLLPVGAPAEDAKLKDTVKVLASRTARVIGILEHLYTLLLEKKDANERSRALSVTSATGAPPPAIAMSPGGTTVSTTPSRRPASEVLELVIGSQVIEPEMKVYTAKQYYWRGGLDVIFHYRVKAGVEL